MGIFSFLKPGGDTVKGALEGAGGLAKDLRVAITGKDPELEHKAKELEAELLKAQTEINKVEAASGSAFVAGWRPMIGWVCAFAIAYHYVLFPLADWISRLAGADITYPAIAMAELFPLVIGMLGMGIMRTTEKTRNVQDNH